MRIKQLEKIPPAKTRKSGNVMVAHAAAGYLILDIYKNRAYKYRYVMDTKTYEYGLQTVESGVWHSQKLMNVDDMSRYSYSWGKQYTVVNKEIISELLKRYEYEDSMFWDSMIEQRENAYNNNKKQRAYTSKTNRINALMEKRPHIPEDFETWILERLGNVDYAIWNKDQQAYSCTACGQIQNHKAKNREQVHCTHCGKEITVRKRVCGIEIKTRAVLFGDIDEKQSAARYLNVKVAYEYGRKREVYIEDSITYILLRDHPKYRYSRYFNQQSGDYRKLSDRKHVDFWDTNPANKNVGKCYLYPANIQETLKGTGYEELTRFFQAAAADGYECDYNAAMWRLKDYGSELEYLYKGRFYRLIKDLIDDYCSIGGDIHMITGIRDMQRINRLRDANGGTLMAAWLAYTEETEEKISDKTLNWFDMQDIRPNQIASSICAVMSPEQIMNYLNRQATQYSWKIKDTLEKWNDYMNMCQNAGKNMSDAMVYRPRELKRRHNEAVEERYKQRMIAELKNNKEEREQRAAELDEKYPGAGEILKEIKSKYEYSGEEYIVTVPTRLIDIVTEGEALHHCVGATDRYFERILDRETYILFLRKAAEPELPYYTLEVEPSGTIRQHRSFYDEEPSIEEIRGFLKEWQQEVRKRMSEDDKGYAARSKKLREKNIAELRAANNTRVLKGLEEDFLEAAV